jgi:plasmid stability protein
LHGNGEDVRSLQVAVDHWRAISPVDRQEIFAIMLKGGHRRFAAFVWVVASEGLREDTTEFLTAALLHGDHKLRREAIAVVGFKKLHQFSGQIAAAVRLDEDCRWEAVTAAEWLRTDECSEALLALSRELPSPLPFALIAALSRLSDGSADEILRIEFKQSAVGRIRVFTAWGLARSGDTEAIAFLTEALNGNEGRRAAQAIADLNGWDVPWDVYTIATVRSKLAAIAK